MTQDSSPVAAGVGLTPLKAWLAYEGQPEWYHASFVCENGAVPYGHLCSHPCFVAGDLWTQREERQEQMRRAGFAIELQNNGEPIHAKKLPKELLALVKAGGPAIDEFYARLGLSKARSAS